MPTVRKAHKRARSTQFSELQAIVTRTGQPITRTEIIKGRRVRFVINPPAGGTKGIAKITETDLGPVSAKKKSTKRKKK